MFDFKGLVTSLVIFGLAGLASAQAEHEEGIPRAELAVDYSYMRANASPGVCGCFGLNGGNAELAVRAYKDLSLVFDLTGVYAGSTSIPGQKLGLLSFTGGPRFSYPVHHLGRTQVVPFVQGLVGDAHGLDGQFPTHAGSLSDKADSTAVLVGGGLDFNVSHRVALRLPQSLHVLPGLRHRKR